MWGAVLAVLTMTGLVVSSFFPNGHSPFHDHPGGAVGAAFFWGYVAGEIKNKIGKRMKL